MLRKILHKHPGVKRNKVIIHFITASLCFDIGFPSDTVHDGVGGKPLKAFGHHLKRKLPKKLIDLWVLRVE